MRGQATLTKDEAEKLVQSACAAMSAELARLRADLAEARAALDRATESKSFSQHDELKQLRTSNHYMTEELTRLREERNAEAKDLAEARADVQRFEQALDAANRELADARGQRLAWRETARVAYKNASYWCERNEASRRTIRALVVFGRAAWRSLRTLAGNQARWQMAQLGVKVNMLLVSERSKTTHD